MSEHGKRGNDVSTDEGGGAVPLHRLRGHVESRRLQMAQNGVDDESVPAVVCRQPRQTVTECVCENVTTAMRGCVHHPGGMEHGLEHSLSARGALRLLAEGRRDARSCM